MEHAKETWADIKMWKIIKINKRDNYFISELSSWETIESKTIVCATWSKHRELWLESEQRLKNKWVSYCATCDWGFFKDKIVAIVWWSDSAVKESLLLAQYASKVYIIYRKQTPRAEPINMKRMQENNKIEVIWNSNVIEVLGENAVSWVKLDTWKVIDLQWLFIEIWSDPNSLFAKEIWVKTTDKWEIITDKFWNTNIDGFFAAWDVTNNPFRQAIVSASEGASCANLAYEFVNKN